MKNKPLKLLVFSLSFSTLVGSACYGMESISSDMDLEAATKRAQVLETARKQIALKKEKQAQLARISDSAMQSRPPLPPMPPKMPDSDARSVYSTASGYSRGSVRSMTSQALMTNLSQENERLLKQATKLSAELEAARRTIEEKARDLLAAQAAMQQADLSHARALFEKEKEQTAHVEKFKGRLRVAEQRIEDLERSLRQKEEAHQAELAAKTRELSQTTAKLEETTPLLAQLTKEIARIRADRDAWKAKAKASEGK